LSQSIYRRSWVSAQEPELIGDCNFDLFFRMYACRAYGLLVGSEFCLLEPSEPRADSESSTFPLDVCVRLGRVEAAETGSVNIYSGYLPEIGQFWIRDGVEITVQPYADVDEQMLRSCILGSAFSVLLQQRGFLILHASAVVMNGQAVAFIGVSGTGKSTTASAFMQHGYSVITDDVLAIRFTEICPEVVPSYPIIKLLPDAVEALNYRAEGLPLLYATSHKRVQTFDCEKLQASYPLRRIYLLSKGDCHEIEPLSTTDALLSFINQSRAVKNLIDPSAKKLHFQQCTELAKGLGLFRLRRKPDLKSLSDIVKLVEDDLHP
jgi:hypothetical protein